MFIDLFHCAGMWTNWLLESPMAAPLRGSKNLIPWHGRGSLKYRTKACCCHLEKFQTYSNNPQICTWKHVAGTQGMLNVWLMIRQDIMHGILQNVWMCWVFWGIKWHAINWNYICATWVWHHDGEWLWSIIESSNKSSFIESSQSPGEELVLFKKIQGVQNVFARSFARWRGCF